MRLYFREIKIKDMTQIDKKFPERILLIMTGGIAAYKCLDLIRRLKEQGVSLQIVMTENAKQFVTEMSVAALGGSVVRSDLFSVNDETQMGHIDFARWADMILIAPATAHFMAKMAHGLADDLASTLCLATTTPVMVAPAMNPQMWAHPATQDNMALLARRGIYLLSPDQGLMACGESGPGRLPETARILSEISAFWSADKPLTGKTAIVTSGPTREAIDPVRYISNHSSGKQGHAIARALQAKGADVRLISGPCEAEIPANVTHIPIISAQDMAEAVAAELPCDIAICAAAVADWRMADIAPQKLKKQTGQDSSSLQLVKNPDILAMIAQHPTARPDLVIGFAAETENLIANAQAKRQRKQCDWLIANDVSVGENGESKVFGQDQNQIYFMSDRQTEAWESQTKQQIANRLTSHICDFFNQKSALTKGMEE